MRSGAHSLYRSCSSPLILGWLARLVLNSGENEASAGCASVGVALVLGDACGPLVLEDAASTPSWSLAAPVVIFT